MPEVQTPTVYQMIRDAVERGDSRFHRRLDAHWLKQYVADASDAATMSAEDWDRYAEATRGMVTRKKEEAIKNAVRVLEDSVNGDDKDLVIVAIGSMHKFLLDALATCVMEAINRHARCGDGFDGRIGRHFQNFVNEFFIKP